MLKLIEKRDKALVSVIVPTRNSIRTIERCLQSIRNQTHPRLELIVVDNSSTDGTAEVALKYADCVVEFGPERSAQRNAGASRSHGDVLVFIDSDMMLDAETISEASCLLTQTEARAIVIPEVTVGEGFWVRCRALERSCYVGDSGVESARVFPRAVFDEVGGYDEDIWGLEDRDLSLRVAGNKQLPRTSARIIHDEGRLRLRDALAKKRYYALGFPHFWRRHRWAAFNQANIVARPAFAKSWRILLSDPLITLGLVFFKLMESIAAASSALPALVKSFKPADVHR